MQTSKFIDNNSELLDLNVPSPSTCKIQFIFVFVLQVPVELNINGTKTDII